MLTTRQSELINFILKLNRMTAEEETLNKIKFLLSQNNPAQAIRVIEQYGEFKSEQYHQEESKELIESDNNGKNWFNSYQDVDKFLFDSTKDFPIVSEDKPELNTISAIKAYAKQYHQEEMKQHDALVKMMAQDEKEGNYEEKCCILQTTFCNIGLDDICVNCGKNITPSPPSNL